MSKNGRLSGMKEGTGIIVDDATRQRACIKRTVRSSRGNSGASLPLALLLFLVCALLASVVLAASTAASGRHVQLAETDERYYSVISAAQLVQEEFQNQPVVVTCTQEKTVTRQMSYAGSSVSQTTSEDIDSVVLTIHTEGSSMPAKQVFMGSGSSTLALDDLTLPERTALCVMLGKNLLDLQSSPAATAEDVWKAASFEDGKDVSVGTYTMEHAITSNSSSVSAADLSSILAVSVHEEADDIGSLSFIISTKKKNEKDEPYSVTLELDADLDTIEEENESEPVVTSAATTRTETSTVSSARTTTIRWTGASVTKGGTDAD